MARPQSRSPGSQASSLRKALPIAFCQASPQSNSSPNWDELRGGFAPMLFLTRLFGVTVSDAERNPLEEKAEIEEIVDKVLKMQSQAAAQQHRPLGRGTHVKGVSARAQFEVLDITAGRHPELTARRAKGMFARPGVYPAIVRFANA